MDDLIPFHRPHIEEYEVQAVAEVLRSGWLTMGHIVKSFEEEFAERLHVRHAVAVNSCTAALHLALIVAGVKFGDEVLVPVITFAATAEVVTYLGATPVLVDVEYGTHNMDIGKAEEAITDRTTAIMPVHFAGLPVDLDAVYDLAGKYKLTVIEDAAHALPASYKGVPIGVGRDLVAFSFYGTKTLVTGEGGMITTNNDAWAKRLRILRLHGMSQDAWKRNTKEGRWAYEVVEPGYKYNLADPAAALGRTQLLKLDEMCERRCAIAALYREHLLPQFIEYLDVPEDRTSAWHLFVIKLRSHCAVDRNVLIEKLAEQKIICSVHFIPLHLQPAYGERLENYSGDYPVAEDVFGRMLSLPIWPAMSDEQVIRVAETINRIVREG